MPSVSDHSTKLRGWTNSTITETFFDRYPPSFALSPPVITNSWHHYPHAYNGHHLELPDIQQTRFDTFSSSWLQKCKNFHIRQSLASPWSFWGELIKKKTILKTSHRRQFAPSSRVRIPPVFRLTKGSTNFHKGEKVIWNFIVFICPLLYDSRKMSRFSAVLYKMGLQPGSGELTVQPHTY